jgi:hypothetical protein
MASPTWDFDGAKRRIYEVPPGSSFVTDSNGYRVYGQGTGTALMTSDVKADLWSRWVDWHALNDWALPAFRADGGGLRPTGENASADFVLQTSDGWRIVLANYAHETVLAGNLFPQGADSLFDFDRLTVHGVVPRLQGSANLLTYNSAAGPNGGASSPGHIADIVAAVIAALQATPIPVNMVQVKGQELSGTGSDADPWGPGA